MILTRTSGLVSVVVASYNHAEFLIQRMDSLINQTYSNIEIIVIDDCSTDNSVAVLRQYEENPKVNLIIRKSNGGWVEVSNQGIELSSGEFVIFANCDDACDSEMIERLVGSMRRNPSAGIAFCRSLMVDKNDLVHGNDFDTRSSAFRKRCKGDVLLSGLETSEFLLESCVIPNLSAALIRYECFAKVGHFSSSYRVCCDWDLFFRIVTIYDVAYIAASLNRFRQHETTIRSLTKDKVTYEEYFRLLLGQIRLIKLSPLKRMLFRAHVMYLWSVHIISPSMIGLFNIPYHFGRVVRIDPVALIFLLPNIFFRTIEVVLKLPRKLVNFKSEKMQ